MEKDETLTVFKIFLESHGHAELTVRAYLYVTKNLLVLHPSAEKFNYKEILQYIGELNAHYPSRRTSVAALAGIKRYYDFLLEIGVRHDHPCRTLNIKAPFDRNIIHQDLFTSEELELLLQREERYAVLKLKNQALISLLIYQAAKAGEICKLKLTHIDLENGIIFLPGTRTLSRRHLPIAAKQFLILQRYITECRNALLRNPTEAFLVGKLGKPVTGDDVQYIISTFKPLFPDRNLDPQKIRQSVIANWLNEKKLPLEQVQLMAGHKWISSTERYQMNRMDEQRALINKFHPLG